MGRTALALVGLLAACSDQAPSAQEAAGQQPPALAASSDPATPSAPAAPGAAPASEQDAVLTLEPEPLGHVIRQKGLSKHGPLSVEISEKDGSMFYEVSFLVRVDGEARSGGGCGSNFTEDPEGPWFVYLVSTHELYAYGGGGWLSHQILEVEPADGSAGHVDGPVQVHCVMSALTAGPRWNPGEELRATLPPPLLELIEES
jgi:hypothetical protein